MLFNTYSLKLDQEFKKIYDEIDKIDYKGN